MTERVHMLREQSLNAVPHLSPERAVLVTEAARNLTGVSPPMRRALTLKHIMDRKAICINNGSSEKARC